MTHKLTLSDLSLNGKKVLIRVDFNVPLDQAGNITDDSRIQAAIPTIKHVLDQNGAVILMSHLGRPKGKKSPEFSLSICAKELSEILNRNVIMAPDCIGEEVEKLSRELEPGQILLLENLRFHQAEEHPEDDPSFARNLSKLADFYINDAFGTAHRAHSSTEVITQYFSNRAAAGFLLQKEIEFLGKTLQNPKRPFYAIIGGAKVSTKIGVLKALLAKVDGLLIGGAMAYTFLKAKNIEIGNSLFEEDFLGEAKELLQNKKLILPEDHLVADQISASAETKVVTNGEGIPPGTQGVDIGPATIIRYQEILQNAATVLWNGPLGVFEIEPFSKGTYAIAETLAESDAITVIGGGDSVSAIQKSGLASRFSHLSTGGGASLEYIESGKLPGIEALSELSS